MQAIAPARIFSVCPAKASASMKAKCKISLNYLYLQA